jgi:hypothetical protein
MLALAFACWGAGVAALHLPFTGAVKTYFCRGLGISFNSCAFPLPHVATHCAVSASPDGNCRTSVPAKLAMAKRLLFSWLPHPLFNAAT